MNEIRRSRTAMGAVLLIAVFFAAPTLAKKAEVSDDLLYDRVNQALILDPLLGSGQLEVRVEDSVVTITGYVATEKLRKRVSKVVKKVKGVKEVRNQVRVRPY